jgi:predicted short-subunit dehydrogenase-like oxidoreductase (DUF2520 family)
MEQRDPQRESKQGRLAVIGAGRMGTALADALRAHGYPVDGPLGRGADGSGFEAVLLCVPDGQIATAAAVIEPGVLVGHCSGAASLGPLGAREAFSLHPLMTVTAWRPAQFEGVAAAVAGSGPRALAFATSLAQTLGMDPFAVEEQDRAAYHAAACVASNFLVTLEAAAEQLAATAGVGREALVPLVRATVENWSALGPGRALTGPVARGDERTIAAQRRAVAERTPELLALFDAMVAATRALEGARHPDARPPEPRQPEAVA